MESKQSVAEWQNKSVGIGAKRRGDSDPVKRLVRLTPEVRLARAVVAEVFNQLAGKVGSKEMKDYCRDASRSMAEGRAYSNKPIGRLDTK